MITYKHRQGSDNASPTEEVNLSRHAKVLMNRAASESGILMFLVEGVLHVYQPQSDAERKLLASLIKKIAHHHKGTDQP